MNQTGLRDWVLQRLSAVIIGCYTLSLIVFFLLHPALDYQTWYGLFSHLWMRLITFFVLFNITIHAWIGSWTIATDYLKPIFIRWTFLSLLSLVLFFSLVWGIEILWS